MTYKDRLAAAIEATQCYLCAGIDPDLGALDGFLAQERASLGDEAFLVRFGRTLIDAVRGKVPAVKPQSAYFEAAGAAGYAALAKVLAEARGAGLVTILDGKRGDIASTMRAYGRAAFDGLGADAMTVTPYMGFDVLEPLRPWLEDGRGAYVVWVSSNASGALIQDAPLAGGEAMKDKLFADYRAYVAARPKLDGALGLVVGATRESGLAPAVREALRDEALLVPGVGAQGGTIEDRFHRILTARRHSLVNVSRGLVDPEGQKLASWDDLGGVVEARVQAYRATSLGNLGS